MKILKYILLLILLTLCFCFLPGTLSGLPPITVTAPVEGERIEPGFLYTVTWDKTEAPSDRVQIHLMRNGYRLEALAADTPNSGSFAWRIPADLFHSTDYSLSIQTPDMAVSGESDLFAITSPPVTYEWNFGDGSPHSFEPNPLHTYGATGTYTWTMTASIGDLSSSTSGTVTVTALPTVNVTSPAAGVSLVPGSWLSILWNNTGTQDPWVKILLLRNGAPVLTLSPKTENDGRFTFQLPPSLPLSDGCSIRVENLYSPISGDSGTFKVDVENLGYLWDFGDGSPRSTEPNPVHTYSAAGLYSWSLTVTRGETVSMKSGTIIVRLDSAAFLRIVSPNGGETFKVGDIIDVKWVSGDLTGDVSCSLYNGTQAAAFIGRAPVETGGFTWTVPSSLTPGDTYRVRISLGTINDLSDSYFTILLE